MKAVCLIVLGIVMSNGAFAAPRQRTSGVTVLEECISISSTLDTNAVRPYTTYSGGWPCDDRHYGNACWTAIHSYKKVQKLLIVTKDEYGRTVTKEVTKSTGEKLNLKGPKGLTDKQRSIDHMQDELTKFIAENKAELCD